MSGIRERLLSIVSAAVMSTVFVAVGCANADDAAAGASLAKTRTFVIVIDGMIPENLNAVETPALCRLIGCEGMPLPDAATQATVYEQARAVMITQTNANHTAMLTGAYAAGNGIIANNFYNRTSGQAEAMERPSLIRIDTLFDAFRKNAPTLRTAAVLGKAKLRELYDCTRDANGACNPSSDNPEGAVVEHVRPDFHWGAVEGAGSPPADCPGEAATGSGYTLDSCVGAQIVLLSETEDPDFVFVNLGGVDGFQHLDGPNSPLGDLAVRAADAEISRIVEYLKATSKWESTVMIVTADHSFSWEGPPPLQRVDLGAAFAADPAILATGETIHFVSSGGAAHFYLDSVGVDATSLAAGQEIALARMRQIALDTPGVSEAWYRLENSQDPGNTLAARRPDWGIDDQRAGDLVVTVLASAPTAGPSDPLAAGTNEFEVASGAGYTAAPVASGSGVIPGDHGHPGTRHVPFVVLGGGSAVVDQSVAATGPVNEGDDTAANPDQAEVVDVAPTIAWLHGLDPAAVLPDADGRILCEAFTTACP